MSNLFDDFRRRLGYVMSLPERTLRSLVAVTGGTTSLLSETLFPEVLRNTTLYKIFVGDTQRFMMAKVAQIRQEGTPPEELKEPPADYLQRKMVGGALETAGLLAMHFSPLWVLALAGDAAAGTDEFFRRLVAQLKANGVLPLDTEVKGLSDLLEAMQDTSRKSATAVDTPPLSREEVAKLAEEMTESYRQMFAKAGNLVPRIEDIWARMETLADRDKVSLERLGGILTLDVAEWGRKGIVSALAVGQTGASLFGEKILDSYVKTLDTIAHEGTTRYVGERMRPFVQSAIAHFHPETKTLTEALFGGGKTPEPAPTAVRVEIKVEGEAPPPAEPPVAE
ncbi:MAG: hypothetical protein GXY44_10125 [Phycisphaerales bacterium]|nr:hypothetical protein [Phycisphaerales bacterium]